MRVQFDPYQGVRRTGDKQASKQVDRQAWYGHWVVADGPVEWRHLDDKDSALGGRGRLRRTQGPRQG